MNIAYNMNCMEAMKAMPDKCFDLAVVDPPYGIGAVNMQRGHSVVNLIKTGIGTIQFQQMNTFRSCSVFQETRSFGGAIILDCRRQDVS